MRPAPTSHIVMTVRRAPGRGYSAQRSFGLIRAMLLVKAFGIWLLILVCAVLNGVLREAVLLPAFEKPAAFVISGLVLSVLIVAVSLAFVPHLGRPGLSHSILSACSGWC